MPGPAVHHLIADRLKNEILREGGLKLFPDDKRNKELRKLFDSKGNLPYLFLGCQGPDFLLFNSRDWGYGAGDIVKAILDVTNFLEEFKATAKAAIPDPVIRGLKNVEDLAESIPAVVAARKFLDKIIGLFDAFSASSMEMSKSFFLQVNLFNLLTHPYGDGVEGDKEEWWWFDILHYRQSGEFAKALIDNALNSPDERLRLYALGYLTHYAADTVGHPYVNLISGGPFRSHPQRHKTGESFQDVYNFFTDNENRDVSNDFNFSNLHAFYNFNFDGTIDTESDDDPKDHIPNPDSVLPIELAELIVESINSVYSSGENGNRIYNIGKPITVENVQGTYTVYYKWLRMSTTLGNTFPAPESYALTEELMAIWEKALNKLGNLGNEIRNAVNSEHEFSIINLFEGLCEIIVKGVTMAAAIAEAILDSMATISGAILNDAINMMYEVIYNAFQTFRFAAASTGFAFPMTEHLDHPLFSQFKKPINRDLFDVNGADVIKFLPRKKIDDDLIPTGIDEILHLSKHLIYPFPTIAKEEKPLVAVSPIDRYLHQRSTYYAFGNIPFTPADILEKLMEMQTDNDDIDEDSVAGKEEENIKKFFGNARLGNAMELFEKSFQRVLDGQPIPDFNLDSDRGYGYLCWKQRGDTAGIPTALVTEDNVDLIIIKK